MPLEQLDYYHRRARIGASDAVAAFRADMLHRLQAMFEQYAGYKTVLRCTLLHPGFRNQQILKPFVKQDVIDSGVGLIVQELEATYATAEQEADDALLLSMLEKSPPTKRVQSATSGKAQGFFSKLYDSQPVTEEKKTAMTAKSEWEKYLNLPFDDKVSQ